MGMKEVCEALFRKVVHDTLGTYVVNWKGNDLDFSKPFRSANMVDLIKEKTGIDFSVDMSLDEAKALANSHHIEIEDHYKVGHIINAFFEEFVESTIIEPTFVCGHPIEISPLAKKGKDERFVERFELFICGSEYANAFTELNDPIDQRERFEYQLSEKDLGNAEANDMDEDYVEALEYGMPPAGGMGIGIDRLVMMVTGSENIREVILFPLMKNK